MPWRSQLSRTPSDSNIASKLSADQPLAVTDINQWRRRIQPSRARTPLLNTEYEESSADPVMSPSTPRKKARPKLSSYFSQYMPSNVNVKPDRLSVDDPTLSNHRPSSEPDYGPGFYDQEPEDLMESIMSSLMVDPFHQLSVRDNSSLMFIFEAYRSLRDQNIALADNLRTEMDCRLAAELEAERADKQWQQEKEEYKAEVRRLEVLIAKGKRGLFDLMRARQDSVLKRTRRRPETTVSEDHKETVFEFLERTRVEDINARMSQRAYLRPRPVSPSQKMAALSHKFSMTSLHADLPFPSLLQPNGHTTLLQASYLEASDAERGNATPLRDSTMPGVGRSEDSTSTNSSFGGSSPYDLDENTVRMPGGFSHADIMSGDYASAISNAAASKHQEETAPANSSRVSGIKLVKSVEATQPRNPKASVQRPRPSPLQLHAERRFSFDAGDDSISDQSALPSSTGGTITMFVRRSTSLSELHGEHREQTQPGARFSRLCTPRPVTMSSPIPSPLIPSSPALSKIPSPVFDPSLARPRREDSSSSVLTIIRHSDVSTSQNDKPASRKSSTSGQADVESKSAQDISKRSSSESGRAMVGKRLIEEKHSLRRNDAAARAAGVLSTRSSSSDILMDQRGKRNASAQSKQSRAGDYKAKVTASPTMTCMTRDCLTRHNKGH